MQVRRRQPLCQACRKPEIYVSGIHLREREGPARHVRRDVWKAS